MGAIHKVFKSNSRETVSKTRRKRNETFPSAMGPESPSPNPVIVPFDRVLLLDIRSINFRAFIDNDRLGTSVKGYGAVVPLQFTCQSFRQSDLCF